MTLQHVMQDGIPLSNDTMEVLKHMHYLWGFDVHLFSYDEDKIRNEYHCTQKPETE